LGQVKAVFDLGLFGDVLREFFLVVDLQVLEVDDQLVNI